MTRNIPEIAIQTHTCLYSRDVNHQRNAIRSNYSTRAIYNDPLVIISSYKILDLCSRMEEY